ncbi:MAG: DUF4397 domain-containing protein [Gammaproteobacteria bacterium]|jgi:hypothetical protein|nr:DUF4397 domain-containing protein [Gammaproteobacteria bacterium]
MNKITAVISTLLLTITSTAAFAQAKVAVAHFAPFADTLMGTAVNISINGEPVEALQGVEFKQFTPYLDLPAGDYLIEVFPVGSETAAITGDFTLTDGVSYTVYAAGDGAKQQLELRALVDDTTTPAEGNLNLRVVHAAPFAADLAATEVAIRTASGDIVNGLVGVPYNVDSGFFEVPAGTYDLKVTNNDGSVNLIDPLPAALPAGANVTVYAVGDGMNQPLGIIAFPVGELPLRDPVDNSTNGTWEIVEGSGTGFIFQPIPAQNRATGSWFTYDADGNPIFLTFDSCQVVDDGMGDRSCSNPGGFDGQMATTDLYLNTGGGPSEDDVVTTTKIGEIDFEFVGCLFGMATVRMDGEMDAVYSSANLTAAFCDDEQ